MAKHLRLSCLQLAIFLASSVVSGQQAIERSSELYQEDDWDYEPRIWSSDETQIHPEIDKFYFEDSPSDNLEHLNQLNESLSEVESSLEQFDRQRSIYFREFGLNLRQNFGDEQDDDDNDDGKFVDQATESQPTQKPVEKCNQFRVDTKDAVICDKNRCDKLDFNWPQHDNHLIVIQTTKHGMRFHQADFTFDARPNKARNKESKPEKIKFDLLELFKPSSTTTTAAPTSTTPASSSTTNPTNPTTTTTSTTTATTTPPTTTTPAPTITTFVPFFSSTPLTTFVPYFSTVSSTQPSRNIDVSQDGNNTQLVTTFRLHTGRLKQKMIGFGGALSDSTCRNIKSLSPEMAKSLMEDYYGDRGLRYNIARLTMGSSDFSITPYTNNDRDGAIKRKKMLAIDPKDDVEMNNFHLTDEDYEFKLPIARQAIATSRNRQLKFLSSLWSPPIWMKNNSHIVHGYLKGDVYGPYYKALAEYILKWHEAYRRNGIEMWATTGLNEPVTGVKPFIFHNSLGITKNDYNTFIKLYLGPMLKQRGFQNTKFFILDDNKGYAPFWVKDALSDQEVAKYVSGVAFHWYMNDEYENLNFLEKYHPDKDIIASEACNGYLPFQLHPMPGDWNRGVAYMYDIIKMIQKNTAAWIDWNMALDTTGGPSWAGNNLDSAIIVNAVRDEYYKSPMFYAIGHFSRFVEPDSMRLDYIIANAKFDYPVEAVAFYTPQEYIVIVALNANKYPVPFKLIVDKQVIRILTLRADSFNTIIFKWKAKK